MRAERLTPYARLPRAYRDLHLLHSTVDAFGRAHWLLRECESAEQRSGPYDAMVVTVAGEGCHETRLSSALPRFPRIDSLPDGGFVLADGRCREGDDQVQVFDMLGRPTWTFQVGDAIEHLLADESGDLWLGYFDEGIFGGDPLSAAGVRRWSSTGEPLWAYSPPPGADWIAECYALNVDGRTAWVYPCLKEGDAPVIRNAGGVVTEDASLVISQRLLGTSRIMLIRHIDCGMQTFRDDDLKRDIEKETGIRPLWSPEAFADLEDDVRQSIRRIGADPFVPYKQYVRQFVFDVETGLLTEVK